MIEWWQHLPEQMNPVLLNLGPLKIYWYSVMYIVAFTIVYFLMSFRISKKEISLTKENVSDYATWAILGTILGGRLGYVFFYDFSYFISHPFYIIWPFSPDTGEFTGISGMSYHGGAIGVLTATWLYSRKIKVNFLEMVDTMAPAVPIAYTFGRIGNFINGELYGRVTDSSIGMYFQGIENGLRHPSQLYEGFFEGIVLFSILWPLRNRLKAYPGSVMGLYLIGYGVFRFFIEFAREPDAHLGFVFLSFSMGQILCFFMILAGFAFIVAARRLKNSREGLQNS